MVYPAYESTAVASFLAASAVMITGIAWALRVPALAIILLGISLVAGQLVRLPLPGQGGGLLLSDVAVVIVLASASLAYGMQQKGAEVTRWLLLLVPFLLWSLFSLLFNAPAYTLSQLGIAAAYWVRLSAYFLLIPALLQLCQRRSLRRLLHRVVLSAVSVMIVASVLQLWLVPNLTGLAAGWDPHEGRLVGTWLDPNFIGAFWLLVIPYLLLCLVRASTTRHKSILVIVSAAAMASLILTKSRSTLVASAVTGSVLLPFFMIAWLRRPTPARSLIMVASLGLLSTLALLSLTLLGERAAGFIRGDATITTRREALAAIWPLARDHAGVGVGYNAYQFAAASAGLIGDFIIHSRAGADASLVTLWVTTGLIGVTLFLLPWGVYLHRSSITWLRTHQAHALIGIAALFSLLTHSLFVNSLLYPHLLATLAILITLTTPP